MRTRTAGPKNATGPGVDGATLMRSALVGDATSSGETCFQARVAIREGQGFAFGRHLGDDLAVDGTRQTRGQEARVVRFDRVDHVDDHLDRGLLAGFELGGRVIGRHDDDVGFARPEPVHRGLAVRNDGDDAKPAARQFLVASLIGRQLGSRRDDDDRVKGAADAL